ncbi:MAG: hypothetical protein ACI8O8_002820 [Oleiphilaceae bacterium]|jgi:hypothetical protein
MLTRFISFSTLLHFIWPYLVSSFLIARLALLCFEKNTLQAFSVVKGKVFSLIGKDLFFFYELCFGFTCINAELA